MPTPALHQQPEREPKAVGQTQRTHSQRGRSWDALVPRWLGREGKDILTLTQDTASPSGEPRRGARPRNKPRATSSPKGVHAGIHAASRDQGGAVTGGQADAVPRPLPRPKVTETAGDKGQTPPPHTKVPTHPDSPSIAPREQPDGPRCYVPRGSKARRGGSLWPSGPLPWAAPSFQQGPGSLPPHQEHAVPPASCSRTRGTLLAPELGPRGGDTGAYRPRRQRPPRARWPGSRRRYCRRS